MTKKKNKTALIAGITGQDGFYLAKLLLNKGYIVWGSSRDEEGASVINLKKLDILNQIQILTIVPEDFRSVFMAIKKSNPDEIYYLAGQSSVGLSFDQPAETIKSIVIGTLNMLEACRLFNKKIRLYNAGSSECFGETHGHPANERTPFNPRSPYAVAKSSSHWLVNNYREAYGLYACSGILFNHESPLRPERFVTQKIIQTAKRIAAGSKEKLTLGRLDIQRDWGWAPEYVEAMWRMLQLESPDDFIIATGVTISLEEFVSHAFKIHDLNWQDFVVQDESLIRPTDILVSRADPTKAKTKLGWEALTKSQSMIEAMTYAS